MQLWAPSLWWQAGATKVLSPQPAVERIYMLLKNRARRTHSLLYQLLETHLVSTRVCRCLIIILLEPRAPVALKNEINVPLWFWSVKQPVVLFVARTRHGFAGKANRLSYNITFLWHSHTQLTTQLSADTEPWVSLFAVSALFDAQGSAADPLLAPTWWARVFTLYFSIVYAFSRVY